MDKIFKEFITEIKEHDDEKMTITAFISTGAVDRMRESLDPEGVDMKNYMKNPVVLWAHDYSTPPIGRAMWAKKKDGGILSKVEFYKSDKAIGEFAQEIYQMYKQKFLNAFSVGFIPKETEDASDKDYNDPKKARRTYRKWEMLEYSAVPVPANPEALQMAFDQGVIKSPMWKSLFANKDEPIQEFDNEVKEQPIVKAEPVIDHLPEINELTQKVSTLEAENQELRFKLFQSLRKNQFSLSEITASSVAKEIGDEVRRVIRKAQGKID